MALSIRTQQPEPTEKSSSKQRLTNEHEAAKILGLAVSTLRRWRWAGMGPKFIKLGSAIRYDPIDLQDFIDRNRRRSTSE